MKYSCKIQIIKGLRLFTLLPVALFLLASKPMVEEADGEYISPVEIAYSRDGQNLACTDFSRGALIILDQNRDIIQKIDGLDRPFDVDWLSPTQIAVSEYGSHQISLIDVENGRVTSRIKCVEYPMGIAKAGHSRLLVTGFGKSEIGVIDLEKRKEISRIPVHYQPNFIAVSPDGKSAFVSNLTPGSASRGARVSKIDLEKLEMSENTELLFGSSNVRQIKCSPDGKWVYVVHTYGKVMLPTSQLERGWVTSNVLSIIDAGTAVLYATVPFDYTTRGAADPWGLALSGNGNQLFASLAGVNEMAVLDLGKLHRYLSGEESPENFRNSDAGAVIASDIWNNVKEDPACRLILADQLSALYAAGLISRIPVPVKGPRGIAVSPLDSTVVLCGYYSGELTWIDLRKPQAPLTMSLGEQAPLTKAREGEMIFHDGISTFQSWLSCVSCHPAGRADGLNWDLLNDGMGNPKNAKSLLLSHVTPPSMSTGIRADYKVATKSGFHFIKFNQENADKIQAVQAYLAAMTPDASPYLVNGKLSRSAKFGKKLFESSEVGCIQCHSGPYFTDQQMHRIGTRGIHDRTDAFDTPSLIEAWRTAPYLHDGSINKLEDLFSGKENTSHWHGKTRNLSEEDISNLVQYIKSL